MSKGTKKHQNKNRKQIERLDTFQSSDDNTSKDSDNFDKTERTILKNPNKFIYFTPISTEKINCYIPSTPKKIKENKEEDEDESYVKGKNLLFIFESM